MKVVTLNNFIMKKVTVFFGMMVSMFLLIISCQKDQLSDPTSIKSLSVSADTTKHTLVLNTDQQSSLIKSSTLSVDWLKTFSATAGDHDYFILQSNTTWTIVSYPSWVTVSPMSGTGNQDVTVTVTANPGAQRTGVIVIAGTGVTGYVTINVLQLAGSTAASTLSVDWLKVFSPTAGDHDFFMVTSNTAWKIISYPNWLTVSPASGSDNGNVTVTVQANTGAERTGTITLSGTGVAQNVSINALQLGLNDTVATPAVTQTPTANYYVSPTGSDSNPGTITEPFYSLTKLVSVIQPGQLAYMRGGKYNYSSQSQINITNISGTSGNLITIENYPGETPTICPGSSYPSGVYGINWNSSSYIHFKGIEITGFVQPTTGGNVMGIWVYGNSNYNIFELINYHNNGFPFLLEPEYPTADKSGQTSPGVGTGNQLINCDFHHNYDPYTNDANAGGAYGNCDGIDVYTNSSTTTTLTGCRSWDNCGDGFDYYAYGPSGMINTINCWAWHDGYKPDGTLARGGTASQGFKIGGYNPGSDQSNTLTRVYTNCFAGFNSGNGFESNGQQSLVNLFNNTSYNNTSNGFDIYMSNMPQNPLNWKLEDNISYKDQNLPVGNLQSLPLVDNHNSWDGGFSVSSGDFLSTDTTGIGGPRNADGSLPNVNFLKLSTSSPLYTGGVDLGLGNGTIIGY